MKDLIKHLEALSEAWKQQFDNPPDISFFWHIEAGFLMVDNHPIAPACAVDPDACSFDVELLHIELISGSYVDIVIDWPFEGLARISEIVTHKVIRLPDVEECKEHKFSKEFYQKMHEICPSLDPNGD